MLTQNRDIDNKIRIGQKKEEPLRESGDSEGLNSKLSESVSLLSKAALELDQRQLEIESKLRLQMSERQSKLKKIQSKMDKINKRKYKPVSMLIKQVGRNKTTSENDPVEPIRKSNPSYNKQKTGYQAPGDIFIKLLQNIETEKVKKKSEPQEVEEKNKKGVINSVKAFQFGTGEVKEFSRDTFYVALEAFDSIYNNIVKNDLEIRSKARDFDFESLLKLIRMYLEKIISEFGQWGEKEKLAVDEIILRTEKSYFANKLKKKFLSDKSEYAQINVFTRLNELEVVSLSKLFKQIKHMLLNRKENYVSQSMATPRPHTFQLKSVVLDEKIIDEAKRRETERATVGKLPIERSAPLRLGHTESTTDSSKRAVPLFAERYRRQTSFKLAAFASENERLDALGQLEARLAMEKMEKKDQEDLDEYVDMIIYAFVTKYVYAMPSVNGSHQPSSLTKDRASSRKKKSIRDVPEDEKSVKNYQINLVAAHSEMPEGSLMTSVVTPKLEAGQVVKKKELVFEVFEKKKDFVLHSNRYRRLPWQRQSVPEKPELKDVKTSKQPVLPTIVKGSPFNSPRKGLEEPIRKRNTGSASKKQPTTNRITTNLLSAAEKMTTTEQTASKRNAENQVLKLADIVASNEVFMKRLAKEFRNRLSPACLQAIAEQRPGLQQEMVKTIMDLAPKFALESVGSRSAAQKKGAESLMELNNIKREMAERFERMPRMGDSKTKKCH